ncbi:MAG: hypothetical protein B6242_11535 [Anaerolineaceae bacterium 4572_78]|nr:MAG: hypothetical protein B6242_11535 [Anaerolineaceae bacterium 4572_78]
MATNYEIKWLTQLNETLPEYLQTLAHPNQIGRFSPCVQGATKLGKKASLGFSCFGMKLYYMLGLWQNLTITEQQTWASLIKSFQVHDNTTENSVFHHAFIDPVTTYEAYNYFRHPKQFIRHVLPFVRHPQQLLKHNTLINRRGTIIAETKQAIATLAEVGEYATYPYRGFPSTVNGVKNYLQNLDWTKPWGAGGRSSALVVFIINESPKFLPQTEVQNLLDVCHQFFESMADAQTGAYFKGTSPAYGQLINGAMKILTALDWLDEPIHYPETLIDTCLQQLPSSSGCHLVDYIYVLYRCLQQTKYHHADVAQLCLKILDMIKKHYNPDGGFSYYIGQSQKGYYNINISHGLPESDIHGTILLTWAVILILEILEANTFGWQVIKP